MGKRFYIPYATDDAEAEHVYQSLISCYDLGPQATRICRLAFKHDGRIVTAEVGQPIDAYYGGGVVLAIMHKDAMDCYFVFTTNRGVRDLNPILAGNQIDAAESFAAYKATDAGAGGSATASE